MFGLKLEHFGLMLKSTHEREIGHAIALFDPEEYRSATTLEGKIALALVRLANARDGRFKNRQKYLTLGAALDESRAQLDAIIALETPHCAHSLRKAIAIARGETLPPPKHPRDNKGHFVKAEAVL